MGGVWVGGVWLKLEWGGIGILICGGGIIEVVGLFRVVFINFGVRFFFVCVIVISFNVLINFCCERKFVWFLFENC